MRAWLQCVSRERICAFIITALTIATLFPPGLLAATASVDLSGVRQTIRGFGGATAWIGQLTDAEMNTLFGSGPGTIGLSILRVRIAPDRNWTTELENARKATARGAIVMATPWTPPASMKTNNNVVGGELRTSDYANYANYLNSFVSYLSSNGRPSTRSRFRTSLTSASPTSPVTGQRPSCSTSRGITPARSRRGWSCPSRSTSTKLTPIRS